MDLLLGQAFNYRVLEAIGSGRSSSVYRAIRTDKQSYFEDEVVLKVIDSEISDVNLRPTLESLVAIRHDHLVNLLCWDFVDNKPAILFESLEAVSASQLARQSELSGEEVVEICRQIQAGLKVLATGGLCHGDLSLDNVLVDVHGRVRLIDYGLGNVLERVGTPPFVAPELFDDQWATAQSDLFALGQIARELDRSGSRQVRSLQVASSWQNESPEGRSYIKIEPNPRAAKDIGKKVRHLLKPVGNGTQSLEELCPPQILTRSRRSTRESIGAMILVGLFCLLMGGQSQSKGSDSAPSADVYVQPRVWLQVEIDGRSVGYTPLVLRGVLPGTHRVSWSGFKRSGTRILTLQPGQTMVLGDDFFK